jgi:ADP-ribose pyrophosphatase YjhB (NUDIX family)
MVRAVNASVVLRVCATLIRDGAILMVRHVHDGRDYWTLPGGAVEAGETLEQAVLREVHEETNLSAHVVGPLYQRSYRSTMGYYDVTEHCFLLDCAREQRASLGHDPELDAASQWLTELAWRSLNDLREDIQVARVLAALAGGGQPR